MKSPYEIRLDLIAMARDTLMSRFNHRVLAAQDEARRTNSMFNINDIDIFMPKASDIVSYAHELGQFVSSNSRSK